MLTGVSRHPDPLAGRAFSVGKLPAGHQSESAGSGENTVGNVMQQISEADRAFQDATDELDRSPRELRALSELVCAAEDLHVVQPENLASLLGLLADTMEGRAESARVAGQAIRGATAPPGPAAA